MIPRRNTGLILSIICGMSLTGNIVSAPEARAAFDSQILQMTDTAHTPVIGIVCDNSQDMPQSQRSRLLLSLPADLSNHPLTFALSEEDAVSKPAPKERTASTLTQKQSDNSDQQKLPTRSRRKPNKKTDQEANVGAIVQDGNHLIYTPPDEFNRNSLPQHLQDITKTTRRIIHLTVRRRDPDGSTPVMAEQAIVLARPPVIMVHGINTSPRNADWAGRNTLAAILPKYGMTPVLLDHGRNDFNHRDPRRFPALDFAGNGPVERAAQQLAETVAQTIRDVHDREHLAIRRVDLIGHSYGGLICRWYLHGFRHDPHTVASVKWYVRSLNSSAQQGIYHIDPDWYRQQLAVKQPKDDAANTDISDIPVRKCVILASMWRGTPLCNYVNELHTSNPVSDNPASGQGGLRLADAPLLSSTVGKILDGPFSLILPTRVPAVEVMAVNSPWLDALNNYQENGQCKPFAEDVSYGCIAGDNEYSLELPGISFNTYELLRFLQLPSWFPYLALEHHQGTINNYTDGLIPLWSALIVNQDDVIGRHPSLIVHANHLTVLTDFRAREYVLCALNNSAWLPTGRMLNARWGQAITSRDLISESNSDALRNSPILTALEASLQTSLQETLHQNHENHAQEPSRKTWFFRPGQMAPDIQNALYPRIAGLGRINPLALREIRDVEIGSITKQSAEVAWHTAAPLDGHVCVTALHSIDFVRYENVEIHCGIEPLGHIVTQSHRFRLSGLQPDTTYHIIVTSEALDETDDTVAVRSAELWFRTKHL